MGEKGETRENNKGERMRESGNKIESGKREKVGKVSD